MNKQKIKFNLKGYDIGGFEEPGLMYYKSEEDYNFAFKERQGWLLFLSEKPFQAENGEWVKFPCAVVEDAEDGKVYITSPTKIQFID